MCILIKRVYLPTSKCSFFFLFSLTLSLSLAQGSSLICTDTHSGLLATAQDDLWYANRIEGGVGGRKPKKKKTFAGMENL